MVDAHKEHRISSSSSVCVKHTQLAALAVLVPFAFFPRRHSKRLSVCFIFNEMMMMMMIRALLVCLCVCVQKPLV